MLYTEILGINTIHKQHSWVKSTDTNGSLK